MTLAAMSPMMRKNVAPLFVRRTRMPAPLAKKFVRAAPCGTAVHIRKVMPATAERTGGGSA